MNTILVVGVETVVGANLAAVLADEHRVIGVSRVSNVRIDQVDVVTLTSESPSAVRDVVLNAGASRVVLCGPTSKSSWEASSASGILEHGALAECWSVAASEQGASLTLVSSDAVFTGPWMFHKENSTSQCPSPEAVAIRKIEQRVQELAAGALVVRTNAYGWSPLGSKGWIESTIAALAGRQPDSADCLRHGTPILATDFAGLLQDAWRHDLQGVYHIAGSERTNPASFVDRLAETFECATPLRCRVEPLAMRPVGFGCGETSLHTKKIRRTLDVVLPTVQDGLQRLRAQQLNGFAERLCRSSEPMHSRVA